MHKIMLIGLVLVLALGSKLLAETVEELQAKLEEAKRQAPLEEAAKVQAKHKKLIKDVAETPTNGKIREELMLSFIVEFDSPVGAARFLPMSEDSELRVCVLLATKKLTKLTEADCMKLGDWYRSLLELKKMSAKGKEIVQARAATYYRRYLALSEKTRSRIEMALCDIKFVNAPMVQGTGFEIHKLVDGGRAFSNRDYVWKDVPTKFKGWEFTQTNIKQLANLNITVKVEGTIYVATETDNFNKVDTTGWKIIDRFSYWGRHNGTRRSTMLVFSRNLKAGEKIKIPQGNWSGTIVIAPALVLK